MDYRLTEVTALSGSPAELLSIVHPAVAVDILRPVLDPRMSAATPIENLDRKARPSVVIESLEQGEQVLLDGSGASVGVFRPRLAEADNLIGGLPIRLDRVIRARLDGAFHGFGSAGGSAGDSDSLATPAAEPTPKPTPPPRESPATGFRTLDLAYYWPSGAGVAGASYAVQMLNGQKTGTLDANGEAHVTGLTDPVVDVRFGEPAIDGELDRLRQQLKAQLDAILQREQREATRLDASTQSLPFLMNGGVHFATGAKGLWDTATGLVSTAGAIIDLSPVGQFNRAASSAWTATMDGSDQDWIDTFKRAFSEDNKRALITLLGFDPSDITREDLAEAYEITTLVMNDEPTRTMMTRFARDFAGAQDSLEIAEFSGGAVFDLVLAILLAALTGGAGAAIAAPRYLKKLAPLADALRELAGRLRIAKRTRHKRSIETNGRCTAQCDPRDPEVDLEPRSMTSRRLVVHSLDEAEQALAASRRQIIKRGGFTPKYAQAELARLAEAGLDDDRFIVRLLETRHVHRSGELGGTLGRPGADGAVRYWSTTLDQIEPSDTDPTLIAEQLGIKYDPEADYQLAIIDKDLAREKADAKTLIPTFDNLKAHVRENVDGYAENDATLDQVMTPEYQEEYRKLVEGMGDSEWEDIDQRRLYLFSQGLDEQAIDKFEDRFDIQDKTGANEHYMGNGLTKHTRLSGDDVVYGALETMTLEKNPQTFRTMTNGGEGGPGAYVRLVALKPIDFGG